MDLYINRSTSPYESTALEKIFDDDNTEAAYMQECRPGYLIGLTTPYTIVPDHENVEIERSFSIVGNTFGTVDTTTIKGFIRSNHSNALIITLMEAVYTALGIPLDTALICHIQHGPCANFYVKHSDLALMRNTLISEFNNVYGEPFSEVPITGDLADRVDSYMIPASSDEWIKYGEFYGPGYYSG